MSVVNLDLKTTRVYDRNKNSKAKIIINRGGARASKCLAKGTEVVMFDGSLKKVETIKLGDKVMGVDSSPRIVLELHQGIGNLYLISQNKGIDYVVEEDHILSLKRLANPVKYVKRNGEVSICRDKKEIVNIPLKEYLEKSKNEKERLLRGYKTPINFLYKKLSLDPYYLGLWLADGRKNRHCISINNNDIELINYIKDNYIYQESNIQKNSKDYVIRNLDVNLLKFLKVFNNKHIPLIYKTSDRVQRLQLIAGIIDGDGCLNCNDKGTYSINIEMSKKDLIEDIAFVLRSLGYYCSIKERHRERKGTPLISYVLLSYGKLEDIPTKIHRKKCKKEITKRETLLTKIKVTPYGIGEYYGFSLDGDGLFLLKDFTVVHNSFSIEQELLLNRFLTEENKQILVVRKTLPSLRQTGHKVWKDWLINFGLSGIIKEEKQFLNYYYGNNYLHFGGLDDPGKAQSTEWNYIWMQEAVDFTYDDYKVLKLRLSAPSKDGKRNQLFMCFNPIDEYHWIKTEVIDKKIDDFEEIHSTYKDNPFLSEDYIRSEILSLKEQDINYYNIFALGQWGRMSSLIFSNWCITDEFPEDIDINNSSYGLDFGFNHPTALCENRIKDDKLFVKEHIYEDGLTNSDLIKKLHQIIPIDKKSICIYADSAEPARIEEIAREGFRIEAAEKEVLNEIDFLKRRKIHIDKNSINILKEIKGYSWRVNKNKRVLDEPVKYKDDLMAAMRYGVYGKFKNRYGSARIRWI